MQLLIDLYRFTFDVTLAGLQTATIALGFSLIFNHSRMILFAKVLVATTLFYVLHSIFR